MRRKSTSTNDDAFGSDSFLDIVANVVGILIILVIIVGLRAKGIPREVITAAVAIADEVDELLRSGAALESEAERLDREVAALDASRAARQVELDQLRAGRADLAAELDRRRQSLDRQAQDRFDLERSVADAARRLEQAERESRVAEAPKKTAVKIESYPTPLSQTVRGKEIHFQLRGGRITYVPLDELIEAFKDHARSRAARLREQMESTDTVGPIDGFRMRYTLERVDVPVQTSNGGMMTGSFARLEEFTLIPETQGMGESLEASLAAGSRFLARMATSVPQKTTVTLWTYPDSFALYRSVKRTLYLQGYSVAGRPLPEGQPIGGSPQGSKSAAQ